MVKKFLVADPCVKGVNYAPQWKEVERKLCCTSEERERERERLRSRGRKERRVRKEKRIGM